jgi:hypothetical protein
MPDFLATPLAAKILGAINGSLLALIFMIPNSRKDALRRFVFAMLSGLTLPALAAQWLSLGSEWDEILAASAIASFGSWWVAGAFVRLSSSGAFPFKR